MFGLGNLSVTFGNPWWLIALPLIVPPLIFMSVRSLAGLGAARRALAIVLRTSVVALLVLALAEMQTVRRNDRLTTLFLLDVSQSIPHDWQERMIKYVNGATKAQKRVDDLAGVLIFGKSAKVESPPTREPQMMAGIENQVDSAEYTNLAGAIKLALGSFPEDTARRIVLISDGNENRGNALEQSLAAAGLKVQIDVLPIEYEYEREVLVEKVSLPPDVKQGETVNINVVVRASEPTQGKLQVYQKIRNYQSEITPSGEPTEVELKRGINVFTLKQTITEPNFYTFTAEFVPDKNTALGKVDRSANNRADGFVYARGKAKVLLIEGTRGEHAELVQALREKEIEVDVLVAPRIGTQGVEGGDQLPSDLAQFQPYDSVILGNVPKDSFTEQQIQLIESNTHDMGGGLVMLGGPNSFGAGGWLNTPIEKALPVDMQIKAMKVMGKSALVMVMHASEIPEGNYWQKVVAQEAIKTLSPYDYAGMLHWEGQEAWLFTLQTIGERKSTMLRAIDRMTPGDMPDFDPSLLMGIQSLRAKTDAMTKHFIVISDGDPTPPSPNVVNQLIKNKITVTSVLVAAHGGDVVGLNAMQNLAQKTKGRFYNVVNPKALPRIYQKEARLISRPLIFEGPPKQWTPALQTTASELAAGLDKGLPPISGIVLTSAKEDVLVEMPLVSPEPKGQVNPLLAHWQYGLGRSVAFTSDAGRKWTKTWPSWEGYAAFWSQVIRWSLRPVEKGNLSLSVRREDGRIKIVVDALDKDNQFLNFLQFQGVVLKPDLNRESVNLVQTAPGRYEGQVQDAEARGNYFVNLAYRNPTGATGLLTAGVSVPYSDEYRELKSNPAKLAEIADTTGGKEIKWKFRRDGSVDIDRTLQEGDVFRRDPKLEPPRTFTDLWPNLLFLATCLFLGDIAVRRVAPDFDRMRAAVARGWQKLRGREVAPPVEYMEKLKGRKAEVTEQIERTRAATRFEPPDLLQPPAAPVDEPLLTGMTAPDAPAKTETPRQPKPGLATEKKAQPESYTDRLMKAKKKVWEEREKDKDKETP